MTYKDVVTAMQKFASAQRKDYVQTKLASIIADAPKKLEQKKQRKAEVQAKVASIVQKATNTHTHTHTHTSNG